MASSASSVLGKSRSTRVPGSNAMSTSITPSPTLASPSNIALFVTNLRLLDLDLRDDWPSITELTFSTKDIQQNQKKRIQSVEWALYQLFALWDPEETRNKLQPFFPPLEQLQSLNLRAALFRCLDQAKKNGSLGRDTVLRKTMLDDCKGERLEELLVIFSNVVLRRMIQQDQSGRYQAIAQSLALTNFSYRDERTVLPALIIAHRCSISHFLTSRKELSARYRDFSDLLDLNSRRIIRRHEQLKQESTQDRLPRHEITSIQSQVKKSWSGNEHWLNILLCGQDFEKRHDVLSEPFNKAWAYAEKGEIGALEFKEQSGLLQDLNLRVKAQEDRLTRWKRYGKSLSEGRNSPSTIGGTQDLAQAKKLDIRFESHQVMQLNSLTTDTKTGSDMNESPAMRRYASVIESMRERMDEVSQKKVFKVPDDLFDVEKGPQRSRSDQDPHELHLGAGDEDSWTSISTIDESVVDTEIPHGINASSVGNIAPAELRQTGGDNVGVHVASTLPATSESAQGVEADVKSQPSLLHLTPATEERNPAARTSAHPPLESGKSNTEEQIATEILNSMAVSSPSPKKPRHTLSLAERTRLSMSRASQCHHSDLQDDADGLPVIGHLSINTHRRGSVQPLFEESDSKHADLIERTRKSMAGFEAAQKKAHLDRRKSVREAKKRQRESTYFSAVEEESTSDKASGLDLAEFMEGQADFESVFKSRPKIKTSPVASPAVSSQRILEDELET